jgi:hypothetical protein
VVANGIGFAAACFSERPERSRWPSDGKSTGLWGVSVAFGNASEAPEITSAL